MSNLRIAIVIILGVIFIVQALLWVTKNREHPKWKQVYFYLTSVHHTLGSVDWEEVKRVLTTRYNLTPDEAEGCITYYKEGELWFVANIKD